MKEYKYIIIGGGITGTTAAETIKSKDSDGSIAIIGDEPYTLYSRVLLPDYLSNKVEEEKVFLRTEEYYKEKKINTFFGKKVVKVDAEGKEIILDNKHSLIYEKLLIASGGRVKKFEIDGINASDILHFQSIDDAQKIKEKILSLPAGGKKVVILGGSFIALELTVAFSDNDLEVSLILRGDRFFKTVMDDESNKVIMENLKENGVKVFLNENIKEGEQKVLVSESGKKYPFDILAVGVGIDRNTEFLEGSGVITEKGVLANEYLETNIKDVFTAGDTAEFYDPITEKRQMYGNWPAAFLQGRVAGLNMAGEKTKCEHVSGYNTIIFGLNISFLGDTKKDEDTMVIKRGDPKTKEYAQLFLRNNLLIGATQLNMNKEKGFLTMLISKKIDLSEHLEDLKDASFDLKSLLNN